MVAAGRRTLVMVAVAALLGACAARAPIAGDVTGLARVVDGDTLEVGGQNLRLVGVDAPELRQTCTRKGRPWRCGKAAARALARKIDGRPVACSWRELDRWRRPVAACRVEGTDLSSWLAERGWALAFRRYAETYLPEERRARAAGRGLWSSRFAAPWDYRTG